MDGDVELKKIWIANSKQAKFKKMAIAASYELAHSPHEYNTIELEHFIIKFSLSIYNICM